ncbi:MAG: ABC transporter ATP-binding protein [Lachnospirales bacterium]
MRTSIEIRKATFGYDKNLVFENIDLRTNIGELFCLMGSNGCGKSSLINCVLKENTLDSGEIYISSKNILDIKVKELAQLVAYIPQTHNRTFPYLVEEIALMGRTIHNDAFSSPDKEDEMIVHKTLDELGILHLAKRPYTKISGGEMQMLTLARALVQESPIIIMDEPTSHLDFYNELLFLEKITELMNGKSKSVFMATHSPNNAFYFENLGIPVKVALMLDGKIFAMGTPSKVLTEENIEKVYRAKTKIIDYNGLKEIVPIRTVR